MGMKEDVLLMKIKQNYRRNYWWLKRIAQPLGRYLAGKKMPAQTIGVFLNPYTSNQERWQLWKRFIWKKHD